MSYPPQSAPPQQYPPQAQIPTPMQQAPAPVKKGRNTVGIVALVMAIVGFIFACIPGALIVGVFVFLAAVGNAVDEAVSSASAVSASPAPGGASSNSGGSGAADSAQGKSRENPYPLRTEISSKDWKVVINSVTFNANDAVAAANQFNEPPAEGKEYVLISYTATYIGNDPAGETPAFVLVDFVTADGVTIDGADSIVVAPDAIDSLTVLYKGASVSGNVVRAVPSASAQDGVLAVTPGLLADKVFVAVK